MQMVNGVFVDSGNSFRAAVSFVKRLYGLFQTGIYFSENLDA